MNLLHSKRRSAFTLIEILVVTGIILALAALLVPVFGRVREAGRARVCASNMQQLGLAFRQYVQDGGGRYPLAARYQTWGAGKGNWVAGVPNSAGNGGLESDGPPFVYNGGSAQVEDGAIYPYVKTPAVYVCPSTQYAQQKRLSYSMNCALSQVNDVRIKEPSSIVLLVDEAESLNDGFFYATANPGNASATDILSSAHNGTGGLLFADGHSKFYPFEGFPLDGSTRGLKNKSAKDGPVRFHDRAFGAPNGTPVDSTDYQLDAGGNYVLDAGGNKIVLFDACLDNPAGFP